MVLFSHCFVACRQRWRWYRIGKIVLWLATALMQSEHGLVTARLGDIVDGVPHR